MFTAEPLKSMGILLLLISLFCCFQWVQCLISVAANMSNSTSYQITCLNKCSTCQKKWCWIAQRFGHLAVEAEVGSFILHCTSLDSMILVQFLRVMVHILSYTHPTHTVYTPFFRYIYTHKDMEPVTGDNHQIVCIVAFCTSYGSRSYLLHLCQQNTWGQPVLYRIHMWTCQRA